MRALPLRRPAGHLPLVAAAVAVALAAGASWWAVPVLRGGGTPDPAAGGAASVHAVHFYDARDFAAAAAATAAAPVQPMPDARGVLLPHHWVGGAYITTTLRDLAASRPVRRVILIGPNHTNAGSAAALTSDWPWATPFGRVEADGAAVAALAGRGAAAVEPEVLTYEHSVAGIVPALRRYLPEATVVPIILRGGLTTDDVRGLADTLAPLLDDGTVLVAAVDFSHGLAAAASRRPDAETLALLDASDWRPMMAWGNEHLDSPASVGLLVETMARLGATRFELRANTSSGEITSDLAAPGTSYIVGYFH